MDFRIKMTGVAAAIAMSLAVMASDPVGGNLLRGAFERDGLGGVLEWGFTHATGSEVAEILPEKGPEGGNVLHLAGDGRELMFRHTALKLIEGERYRLSVWVRTKGLAPGKRAELLIYPNGWSTDVGPKFPPDTDGRWVKVDWEGAMPPSQVAMQYFCTFYFGPGAFPVGAFADVSSPVLEPLTDKARAESSGQVGVLPFKGRIVPVDPLLHELDPHEGKITFYWPGDVDTDGVYDVSAEAFGKTAVAALGADRRATVRLGAIGEGDGELRVSLRRRSDGRMLAENIYSVKARMPVPEGATGKRLNNFVTELLSVPLRAGTVSFVNPREGWVFVGFSRPVEGVTADVDDIASAVRYRAGEPSETMRHLKAGEHRIVVKGEPAVDATLSVRLVKPLVHGGARYARPEVDLDLYRYGHDFYVKHGLYSFFNTASIELDKMPAAQRNHVEKEMGERGIALLPVVHLGPIDKERNTPATCEQALMKYPVCANGGVFAIDESGVGASRQMQYGFAETLWRLRTPRRTIWNYWNDATSNTFKDPRTQASVLSALLNSGDGTACFLPEIYLRMEETRDIAYGQMAHHRAFAESMRKMVPAAPKHTIWYLGGWLVVGQWSPYCSPDADLKALYADFLQMLATDPEFADVGGIGFSAPACDEGVLRWVAGLIHYYGIEGGTENVAAKCGLAYLPGHMANGDFADGFAGWTAEPAEADSLTAGGERGYGTRKQKRIVRSRNPPKPKPGDCFAIFRRSGKCANRLSRKLTGLTPGLIYEVTFCTADRADAQKPGARIAEGCIDAVVEGAEMMPAYALNHPSNPLAMDRKRGIVLPNTVTHRRVFKALAAEANLVFTDWRSATEPGGEIGAARILNHVGVRRYFPPDEKAVCGR